MTGVDYATGERVFGPTNSFNQSMIKYLTSEGVSKAATIWTRAPKTETSKFHDFSRQMSDFMNHKAEAMADRAVLNATGPTWLIDVGSKITTRMRQNPASYCQDLKIPDAFYLTKPELHLSPEYYRKAEIRAPEMITSTVTLTELVNNMVISSSTPPHESYLAQVFMQLYFLASGGRLFRDRKRAMIYTALGIKNAIVWLIVRGITVITSRAWLNTEITKISNQL